MLHCYIFDYSTGSIYHIELPDEVEDVEDYICEEYNLKYSNISFMTVEEPIDIINL